MNIGGALWIFPYSLSSRASPCTIHADKNVKFYTGTLSLQMIIIHCILHFENSIPIIYLLFIRFFFF